jgi:hypothetical protein
MFCVGCQSVQPKKNSKVETPQEMVAALGTVTEGLTNQNISRQDLKNLAIQVQKDSQTKSAVQVINQALNAHQTGVKYCPINGERFDASVDECPIHKVKLKFVE